jgi:hypothetical protein
MSMESGRQEVIAHYQGLSNSARLFMTFGNPFGLTREVEVEAWGQLCTGDKRYYAAKCLGWDSRLRWFRKYLGWRCVPLDSNNSVKICSGIATDDDRIAIEIQLNEWRASANIRMKNT